MQKVSYMGDGSTTEFYFNFPFFENSNVVVTVNDEPATGYTIIGTSGGLDADIPYIGGKVVFETAPTSIDCITIARQLPLERIVDYQPLSKIDPTTLNQDLNYLMEVIKDRKDELADLMTKYEEIADKESTDIILARISAIHEEIVDIDAKIQALGDIGTLRQEVTNLATTVVGHTTSIGALNTTVGNHTTSISDLNIQKSNIDIDNISALGKENIINVNMPDYSAGTDVSLPFTAPTQGVLYIALYITSDYYKLYVNDNQVGYGGGSNNDRNTITVLLSENDVVTKTGGSVSSAYFYPCKGVA